MADIEKIKKLREETTVSINHCRQALDEANGDLDKAREILKKRGGEIAEKKAARGTEQGVIESYIHTNKKIGVLLELACETDFVAKSDDFQNLARELCLQIAGLNQETPLLEQLWIKDQSRTIAELVKEYIARLGENIIIKRFTKYEIN